MAKKLCEAQVLELSILYKEVAILRSEIHTLAKNHVPIIPLILIFLTLSMSILPLLIFTLLDERKEAQTIRAKRE